MSCMSRGHIDRFSPVLIWEVREGEMIENCLALLVSTFHINGAFAYCRDRSIFSYPISMCEEELNHHESLGTNATLVVLGLIFCPDIAFPPPGRS